MTTDDADAVQAAGDRVAAAAELAAGVQHGQHDLDGAAALGLDDVDRDAAAVVGDADAAVGEQRDVDRVGVAGERLVDGVVDDLVDEVVQAALAGGPDVHAGALAHRLEALEHGDGAGVVGAVDLAGVREDAGRRRHRSGAVDGGERRRRREHRRAGRWPARRPGRERPSRWMRWA